MRSILTAIFILLMATSMVFSQEWFGTDNEPADGDEELGNDVTYILDEPAPITGTITQIEYYVGVSGGDLSIGIFTKSGSDFTDIDSIVNLSSTSGLHQLSSPGDFTAMPINAGEYLGCMFVVLERNSTGASGFWYDAGPQIGNNSSSTYTDNAGTNDIQLRAYITTETGVDDFIGTQAEPADKADATLNNYTLIYDDAANIDGTIALIECYINTIANSGVTIQFAIMHQVSTYVFRDSLVSDQFDMTQGSGYLDTFNLSPPLVIKTGQYLGFYITGGGDRKLDRELSGGGGDYYFNADRIDGTPSNETYGHNTAGRDIQIRGHITMVDGKIRWWKP